MANVFWDTMLFVYWLEENAEFGPRVEALLKRMDERGDQLCTSVFTLAELLVGPKKQHHTSLEEQIRAVFRSPAVRLLPFTETAVEHYAEIRASHRVAPADAIQLACAADAGIDLFLTNDHRLQKLNVQGIDFIAGLDGAVL